MKEFMRSYHIMSHKNTDIKLLAVNAFTECEEEIKLFKFERNNNSLSFIVNDKFKYIFEDISELYWDDIHKKRLFLVEFGPLSPIAEYEIVLS